MQNSRSYILKENHTKRIWISWKLLAVLKLQFYKNLLASTYTSWYLVIGSYFLINLFKNEKITDTLATFLLLIIAGTQLKNDLLILTSQINSSHLNAIWDRKILAHQNTQNMSVLFIYRVSYFTNFCAFVSHIFCKMFSSIWLLF